MKRAEFFFDFGSPASYLAYTQLDGIARRTGAEIVYRPMLLGGVFKATGNASPAMVPAKGKWMNADLARFARRYGVPFAHNPFFPVNTLLMMRGAVAAEALGCAPAYIEAMFAGMWEQGLKLDLPDVWERALAAAGLPVAEIAAGAQDPANKARLVASTEAAVARGAFGSPTFFLGDEMWFGKDRLRDVVEAAAGA